MNTNSTPVAGEATDVEARDPAVQAVLSGQAQAPRLSISFSEGVAVGLEASYQNKLLALANAAQIGLKTGLIYGAVIVGVFGGVALLARRAAATTEVAPS